MIRPEDNAPPESPFKEKSAGCPFEPNNPPRREYTARIPLRGEIGRTPFWTKQSVWKRVCCHNPPLKRDRQDAPLDQTIHLDQKSGTKSALKHLAKIKILD